MAKIRLLNDGGYSDSYDVVFPVEVEAVQSRIGFDVSYSELSRVGFNLGEITDDDKDKTLYFSVMFVECEVIS